MMTKPTIKIHNVQTGEIIEREMSAAELKQYEADQLAFEAKTQAEAQKAIDKAALLEQLGITADQAKLLLS
jgi:hypothetical protein